MRYAMRHAMRSDRRRGFAMMLVMGAVAVVFVIGLMLLSGLPAEARVSKNLISRERAVFLAESGIAEAMHRMEHPPVAGEPWTGVTDRSIGGEGTYTVSVTDLGNSMYRIESTGRVSDVRGEVSSQQIAMLVQMTENGKVNFDITDEVVTVNQRFAAKTGVAGVEIEDYPVTVRIRVGDTVIDPFGDYTRVTRGNINTGENTQFTLPDEYEAGSVVTIEATSWQKKQFWYSGTSDNHWQSRMTVSTGANSPYVKVLRNGDALPNIAAWSGQASISELVSGYVDANTNTVKLAHNQVIFLFELYTTNLSSQYADFQDLVLVIDFAKDIETFSNTSDSPGGTSGGSSIGMLQWSRTTVGQ